MNSNKTTLIVYHVYVKVDGTWFDKLFPAKDCGHENEPGAITMAEAKAMVGFIGSVRKITTTEELVVQNSG